MRYLEQRWNTLKLIQNAIEGTMWNTVGKCGTEWNRIEQKIAELNLQSDGHLWIFRNAASGAGNHLSRTK